MARLLQRLLFPDPRPIVERLGPAFFQQAPQTAGVYLMRDSADTVLYVGKAKNLRRRLCCYRIANPDRMPRRHLRLLRAVARIEFEQCASESAALARESELLLALRPRFNRAGTWKGPARYLLWRVTADTLDLSIARGGDGLVPVPFPGPNGPLSSAENWKLVGPLGGAADHVRAALARLVWSALNPARSLAEMPHAWFKGRLPGITCLSIGEQFPELQTHLQTLFEGTSAPLENWLLAQTSPRTHPFETSVRDSDLETLRTFAEKQIDP